jgi:chorismate mutase
MTKEDHMEGNATIGTTYPRIVSPAIENIEAGRQRIDQIDEQILAILNQRADVALAISALRGRGHGSGIDIVRESQIIGMVTDLNQGPFSDQAVSGIFLNILQETKALQRAQGGGPGSEMNNGETRHP